MPKTNLRLEKTKGQPKRRKRQRGVYLTDEASTMLNKIMNADDRPSGYVVERLIRAEYASRFQ